MDLTFHRLQLTRGSHSNIQVAVETAITTGYRHIDTAYCYQSEGDVGKALESKMNQGVVKREDMFIVSKVGATDRLFSMTSLLER